MNDSSADRYRIEPTKRLRQLFDDHYKEQVRLVDVLIERIRALDRGGRVFAGDFLHAAQFSQMLHGRASITCLLGELLDAHEMVLSVTLPAGTNAAQVDRAWMRDFAVGQVVLTNDQQILAIGEQRKFRERMLQTHATWVSEIE